MDKIKAYHGTTSLNLESILKEGLVSKPERKLWKEYTKSSIETPCLNSLDGIYFSTHIDNSLTSANYAVDKRGGQPVIFSCLIDKNDMSVDEDSIWYHVETVMSLTMDSFHTDYNNPSTFLAYIESWNKIDQAKEVFSNTLHKILSTTKEKNYGILHDMFNASLNRVLAHSFSNDSISYRIKYQSYHKEFKKCKFPITCIKTVEDEYLRVIDDLCSLYRNDILFGKEELISFRVLTPVTMESNSKILDYKSYL